MTLKNSSGILNSLIPQNIYNEKTSHGRITAAWWGEKESNLDLLEKRAKPKCSTDWATSPKRGRERYPLFYPQTFNIALFGKKGQIPLPYPWGVGATPIKPTSHIKNDPLGDVEQNHPLHTLILKPKPIYEKTIATHVGIGLSGRESNPHLAPMEYSRL